MEEKGTNKVYTSFDEIERGYYQTIVADPPWEYNSKRSGGSMKSGAAQKYPTMSLEDICDLPVPKIAADNCILFLWVTTPLKDQAFQVWDNWGFTYKTTMYWHKKGKNGTGYWYRGDMEECWIGIKGKVKPFGSQFSNVIQEKPRGHSKKPETFWERIKPHAISPCIELFSRQQMDGWDAFGNQVIQHQALGV